MNLQVHAMRQYSEVFLKTFVSESQGNAQGRMFERFYLIKVTGCSPGSIQKNKIK